MMTFCTAINCMDGRVQIPVITYLKAHFSTDYVDIVSEPGPNGILASRSNTQAVASIEHRVELSITCHQSVGIAVVGHYDCAGNPGPKDQQQEHTLLSVLHIRNRFPSIPVIGLWVSEQGEVSQVSEDAI